jgi:hypothetical protein
VSALRILYHMARADFLERTRRYSFLVTLGLALFLGYSIASGQLTLVVGQNYRGVINSAWVGGLMAAIVNLFLGLFGFYLVKGSIQRDYETGVGLIMAATPLRRPLYTLGKWLSNFAVLAVMVVILAAVAVAMQLLYREDPVLDWWALLAPFLLLILPFMAFTASLAVLFETIGWLRGGLGNVVYFFFFLMVITMLSVPVIFGASPDMELLGVGILSNSMGQAAKAAFPAYDGSFNITWIVPKLRTFHWYGIAWTPEFVFSRVMLVLGSVGIAGLAALFFDRFNPARVLPIKHKRQHDDLPEAVPAVEAIPAPNVHLTPLEDSGGRFRFGALFIAELKLFLKGQRWWWYAVAAGLIAAQLFAPADATRILLVAAWVWPVFLLSGLGCRENRWDTRQIVFSAPRPIAHQLPAAWLSALFATALLGSGALARFLIAGDAFAVAGWLTGALFIPSLALACGVLTGSSKAFEILYVIWMYMIIQKVTAFDFIGMTPESPLFIYIPLALALLALAAFARGWQLKSSGAFGK